MFSLEWPAGLWTADQTGQMYKKHLPLRYIMEKAILYLSQSTFQKNGSA